MLGFETRVWTTAGGSWAKIEERYLDLATSSHVLWRKLRQNKRLGENNCLAGIHVITVLGDSCVEVVVMLVITT